jgi:hypothetical protein
LVTSSLISDPDQQGRIRWEDLSSNPIDLDALHRQVIPDSRFHELPSLLSDGVKLRELKTDYKDWIYHSVTVSVRANEELKVYAGPQVSQGDFRRMCAESAEEGLEQAKEKTNDSIDKKLDIIRDRLIREERELEEDKAEHSQRKLEEVGTLAENLFSLIAGRQRRLTTSLTKRRMTTKAKADVNESLDMIEQYTKEIEDLERDRIDELREVEQHWREILEGVTEIPIPPYKKDILVELFGVGWFPYYTYQDQGRDIELAAFSNK